MIIQIFTAIFIFSGLLALLSLRDFSKKPKEKILRKEKKGMFGVINLRN